jgi:hypothetical protein
MLKVLIIDRCEYCDGETYTFAVWAKSPGELCLHPPGQSVVCCLRKLPYRVFPPKKTHLRQNLKFDFSPSHSRKYLRKSTKSTSRITLKI